jgi:hypothetical protein
VYLGISGASSIAQKWPGDEREQNGIADDSDLKWRDAHWAFRLGCRLTDRGRIATGLIADLIAVPGDPLADVRVFQDVRFVMKDGKVYHQAGASRASQN